MKRLVRLNYLAPDILAAIIDGTQPERLTRTFLMRQDLPLDWALQRRQLGFRTLPANTVRHGSDPVEASAGARALASCADS